MDRRKFLVSTGSIAVAGCISSQKGTPGGDSAIQNGTPGSDSGIPGNETDETGSSTDADSDSADEWPMFAHDSANSGFNPGASGPGGDAEARRIIGESEGLSFVSSAATVVDGTIYAGAIIDGRRVMMAVSAANEELEWTFPVRNLVHSAPAVSQGRVYFGVGYYANSSGRVIALNAGDGSEEWSVETEGPIPSSVVVRDGSDFAGRLHPRSDVTATSEDSSLSGIAEIYRLDAESGEENWRAEFEGPSDDLFGVHRDHSPAIEPETNCVVFGTDLFQSSLRGFSLDSGEVLWTYPLPSSARGVAIADGSMYYSGRSRDYFLKALNSTDLDSASRANREFIRWSFSASENITQPAVDSDSVYIGADGHIVSLSADDGSEQWSESYGGEIFTPSVAGDTVFFSGKTTGVVGVDRSDGSEQFSFDIGVTEEEIPVTIVGEKLYVSGSDGLYVVE